MPFEGRCSSLDGLLQPSYLGSLVAASLMPLSLSCAVTELSASLCCLCQFPSVSQVLSGSLLTHTEIQSNGEEMGYGPLRLWYCSSAFQFQTVKAMLRHLSELAVCSGGWSSGDLRGR